MANVEPHLSQYLPTIRENHNIGLLVRKCLSLLLLSMITLPHSITDMYILTSITQKMFKQLCKQVIPAHGN
ncbi:hypothetical protein MTR_5g071225 [Medicago truncatula]|uniref:GCM domain-containing protein n=1 Tax=Medicago truncatula TaxID=3880 RepID=A0A072UEQ7_MEDTR|nr:hypothetical protein MTR_5g071225 [Medicago truncatula]